MQRRHTDPLCGIKAQQLCLKLLYPVVAALSYSQALNERLDFRRDVITQIIFQEIKDAKHPAFVATC